MRRKVTSARTPNLEENVKDNIVDTLFSVREVRNDPEMSKNVPPLLFTDDNLKISARSLKNRCWFGNRLDHFKFVHFVQLIF